MDQEEKKDRLELVVRTTDGSSTLRFRVHALNITVGHAFGPDARYKGRNQEPFLEIEPVNLEFSINAPNGMNFDGVDAADVLAAVLGPIVRGCEIVVREALEREREVEREKIEQVKTRVKPI